MGDKINSGLSAGLLAIKRNEVMITCYNTANREHVLVGEGGKSQTTTRCMILFVQEVCEWWSCSLWGSWADENL